jgi:hypothetical protein
MGKYKGKTDESTIPGRLKELGVASYADYLASDHWKSIKQRYRASNLPQGCGCGARATALHHRTYARLGAELLTDLEPVCQPCHRKLHNVPRPKPPVEKPKSTGESKARRRRRQRRFVKQRKNKAKKGRVSDAERRRLAGAEALKEWRAKGR